MTDERPSIAPEPRTPFSQLRSWEPERDPGARGRALNILQLHIAESEGEAERGGSRPSRSTPSRARPFRGRRLRVPRRWLGSAIALVAVAGAGGALAAVLLSTAHTNRLPVFTPQGRLSPEFHVGARGRGYCWESSLASTERNAYRCFEGNEIHDPCFAASTHAADVVCFLDPWRPVTVLRLTRRLPEAGPPVKGPPLPWTIVTDGGEHCTFMTGATALVGGQRVNYACTDGTYLIGNPNTRQPLWTIRSDRHLSLKQMHTQLSRFPVVGIKQTIG